MAELKAKKKVTDKTKTPDYKIVNMVRVVNKIGADKYRNFYGRMQLFTRGLSDQASKEMLKETLATVTAETDIIKAALKAAIAKAAPEGVE